MASLLDGHLVQGHVDGVGTIESKSQVGAAWRLTIAITSTLIKITQL